MERMTRQIVAILLPVALLGGSGVLPKSAGTPGLRYLQPPPA